MSYNRKLLKQMTEESKQKKPQPKPKDRIVDPMGQWAHPGEITRIPSNRITMQGVPYPVLGRGSDGSEQMMYPEQEYVFSGSDYVDEFPLVKAQTGINLNLPQFKNEKDRRFKINPYTFSITPEQNVNVYGIGTDASLNVFRNKKNRFDLTGDVSSSSISYPGGVELFGKPQFSGGLRFTHTFRDGGEPTPLELAKIKAKMALESHFGNPSARRMTTPYPQDLAFKLNAGPNKGKMGYGTHWMRTIDNYAVPNIQEDASGKLFFNQNASPLDREAMRFNSPEEALMFAENYKEVAPMSREKYLGGGDISIPNLEEGNWLDKFDPGGPVPAYLKAPMRGDIQMRGNQNLLTEIAYRKSKEKKAEEQVQKLIQYKNYDEKAARRAVQNKTKSGERDLKEIERVEARAAAHPDYKSGISFPQMQALSDASDLRSRFFRGYNLLTNQGTPLDFVTEAVTSPAKIIGNVLLDPKKQYLNPENTVTQNLANLGWDMFGLFPFQMAKGAGNALQHVIKEGVTPIGYNPINAFATPINSLIPKSLKYKPVENAAKNRYAAWDVYKGKAPSPEIFTRNADNTLALNDFRIGKEFLDKAKNYPKDRFPTTRIEKELNFAGVHGNGMVQKGVDEQGRKFIDFTDKWDIQPMKKFKKFLPKKVSEFELSSLLDEGQPFKLKNRIYYDDAGNYYDNAGNKLIEETQTIPKRPDWPEHNVTYISTPGAARTPQMEVLNDWESASGGNWQGLTAAGTALSPLFFYIFNERNNLQEKRKGEEWQKSGYDEKAKKIIEEYDQLRSSIPAGGSLPKFQMRGEVLAYARGPMIGDIQMRGNVNIPTQMAYDASKIRQAQAAEQAARTRTTIDPDTRTSGERQKAREFTEQVNKRRKEMGLLEGTGYLKDREKANKILSNIMTPLEAASYVTGVGSIGSNFLRLGASALEKQIGKNLVSKGLKNATSYVNPIINKADEALAYAQLDPIGIMGNKLNTNLYNPTTAINRANNTITGIDRNLKNSGVEATDLVLGDGLNNTKNLVNLATNTESILPKSSVKDAFKNTGVTLNEFIGELISGKSNRKSIEEGNQWLQNWISHPATQAKIEKDMNNAIKLRSSVSNNSASDVYDLELLELIKNQSKNFKPASKEYSLKKQLEENLKQYFTPKNLQNVHVDNWGVSYMHGYSPEARNRIASGITLPPNRYGSWISRTPTMNQTERVGTTIHEGTHDWVSNAALKKSGMRNEVLSSMDPKIKNDFLEWETLRNSGQDPKKIMGEARAHQAYLADPTEVHARIMELRKHLGITPETVANEKYANEVIDYLKALPESKRPIDIKLLNVIKGDPKKLSNLFNKLWAASPYAIPAAGVLGASQQKKQGGQTNWLDKYN